ncbi:hypothetical protein Q9L58_010619 [Maublancomyces gigas]|uniref:C2H2-type domain-containing protein n=1 Tax=Discina gigas TaxID=1032678 RepID=A0ABR3G3M0_9PEZI
MPTHSNPESRCLFCRCSYRYATAFEIHIRPKHTDLAELYFTGGDAESLPEDAGPLPYVEDEENDLDGEKIAFLDYEEDENIYHRKGPFIQTFANAGRPTGDDCCLANWLINSKISMTKINEFYSSRVYISDGGSFMSANTLHAVINHLPTTLGEPSWSLQKTKVIGEEDGVPRENITYAYRNPMTCIQYLLRQSVFANDMVFSPVKEFVARGEQCYSELHTPDWWWDMQATLPLGATVVAVICASDQTHLTNFSGDRKAWPVYLTIGNIKSKTRNRPSKMAFILLALLPIPRKVANLSARASRSQSMRSCIVLNKVLKNILAPLQGPGVAGLQRDCTDGKQRFCFPVLCAWLADHLEHVTLQNLENNGCPVCEVVLKDLNALTIPPPLRDHDAYKVKATAKRESEDPTILDYFISKGIKAPFNTFIRNFTFAP